MYNDAELAREMAKVHTYMNYINQHLSVDGLPAVWYIDGAESTGAEHGGVTQREGEGTGGLPQTG